MMHCFVTGPDPLCQSFPFFISLEISLTLAAHQTMDAFTYDFYSSLNYVKVARLCVALTLCRVFHQCSQERWIIGFDMLYLV